VDRDIISAIVFAALLGAYIALGRKRGPNDRILAALAASVNRVRAMALHDTTYLPVPSDDQAPMAGSEYYDAVSKELAQAACRELGDRVEQTPEGALTAPSRWFVDATGTVCGWFGVVAPGAQRAVRQVMYLFSEAGGDFYVTGRGGANAGTAGPPTQHEAECRWADGIVRQLEVHRAQMPAAPAPTHVTTIDDALALTHRMRAAKRAWRAGQLPDALLDLDLRQILQDRYPTVGASLLAYMTREGTNG
jgi:hypothetical protein